MRKISHGRFRFQALRTATSRFMIGGTMQVAAPPKVKTLKVQSLKDLDDEFKLNIPGADASFDLSLLLAALSPHDQVATASRLEPKAEAPRHFTSGTARQPQHAADVALGDCVISMGCRPVR